MTESSPAARGYAMPPEWAPHERTWMIFPPAVYPGGSLPVARAAWAAVARAIAEFEPVTMLVRPEDEPAAAALLNGAAELRATPLDDAWARDTTPTFVTRAGAPALAVRWRFNGWGAQPWATWEHDARLGAAVAAFAGVEDYDGGLTNEGGGIEVDGRGLVVLTETVQRDPDRNPGLDRPAVEALVHAALGTTRAIWLARGLSADYGPFGTRGHVDLVVKFVPGGAALVHAPTVSHPDHAVAEDARRVLREAGREVVDLPAPTVTHRDGALVDWSYVNCYVCNGGVVAGTFDDPSDDAALGVLRTLFPNRRVIGVDVRPLFALGGGVHCITQQQPR